MACSCDEGVCLGGVVPEEILLSQLSHMVGALVTQ